VKSLKIPGYVLVSKLVGLELKAGQRIRAQVTRMVATIAKIKYILNRYNLYVNYGEMYMKKMNMSKMRIGRDKKC
jgi:hypothetical protein